MPTEPFDVEDVRRAGALELVPLRVVARDAVAPDGEVYPRSAADMLSNDRAEFAWFARFKSFCNASFFALRSARLSARN